MKAYINNGTLMVVPENSTEEYALTVWLGDSTIKVKDDKRMQNHYIIGSAISIDGISLVNKYEK